MIIDATVDINKNSLLPIKLSNNIMSLINNFAPKCAATNRYQNMNKLVKDITIGKMGEVAAHKWLKHNYPMLSLPDFNLYKGRQKSWAHDLIAPIDEIHFSVKAQEIKSAKQHGESWTFARKDKSVYKTDPKHYAVFVLIDPLTKICQLRAIVLVDNLHKLSLFSDMKIEWLRATKQCVYYKDLVARYV